MIYTKEPLDRETTSFFWLTVYAQDLGSVPLSSMTEIYVEIDDINDNIPLTANPVYYPTIPEHSPEGTSVLQLQAFDLDDEASPDLTYEITGGNPQGFFAIDRQTGRLRIWKKIGLLSTLVISNNYTTYLFFKFIGCRGVISDVRCSAYYFQRRSFFDCFACVLWAFFFSNIFHTAACRNVYIGGL